MRWGRVNNDNRTALDEKSMNNMANRVARSQDDFIQRGMGVAGALMLVVAHAEIVFLVFPYNMVFIFVWMLSFSYFRIASFLSIIVFYLVYFISEPSLV